MALINRLTRGLLGVGGGLRARIISGAAGSFGTKAAAMCTSFGVTVVLARYLGANGYGVYSYAFALISLLAVPAQFGLPDLVVRETAKAHANSDWSLLAGIWRWTSLAVIVFSLPLVAIALIVSEYLAITLQTLNLPTFYWGLALTPLIALTKLRESSIRGLRYAVLGQVSDSIVRPALLVFFVLIAVWLGRDNAFHASQAMSMHVFASALALILSSWILHEIRPHEFSRDIRPIYRSRQWAASALPLAFIAGMVLINGQADLIMLGLFRTPEEVGVYRVAAQGATLVSFGLSAIAMVSMPYFARFHERGEMQYFQRLATNGARLMFGVSVPVAVIYVIFGRQLIRLVFGGEFDGAYQPLMILSVAHVIHAGFGIVGPLLNMTGHEKVAAKGIATAAVTNVTLNFLFIPPYGVIGAAVATASTFIVWNLVLWVAVRRRLGIDSSVIGLSPKFLR